MYIKEIEIDNFKSFANKVTVPLREGFTAISGPNGSGKSNIIDGVLFALGLQNARALRSEEGVADLITNHNKRGEASVKVTFALEDGREFSIKRHIKKGKNGTASNYFYNDKPVTRTQIHLELEKYNISPNSYNIMMQGDVTTITKCNPVERRKYIDEIAGTADFDRKIELAGNQIQDVEDRIANTNILMNEIDGQVERLKEQREVALKYKKFKDEKTALENQIQSAKYFDVVRSLELVHQNILLITKQKKEFQEKLKEAESKIADTKLKYDEINAQVKAQGEEKQLEVKKHAEEKKGEIERKKSSSAFAEKTIVDNLKSIDDYKNGIEHQNKEIEKNKVLVEEKKEETKKLEKELKAKQQERDKIYKEITGLNKSADEHIQNRNKLRKELEELNDSTNALLREQYPKESEFNANEEKIASTKENLEKLKHSAKIFEDEKDKLNLQIEKLEQETKEFKIILSKTIEELDKTRTNKDDCGFELTKVQRTISTLEANKTAYKSVGAGSGVETVMNAKIKGVHKPLAQLADIEEEYIDAINVAMGARATSIVVDTQDVAYQAIQILKSNGKRASFIPLNIIKKAPSRLSLPKDKGVIDFAINLIDFDDEYIDAFYFALGETIVVEDNNVAKKLAGKYRIVTLDGDITEKSGYITGGAKQVKSSLFDKSQERQLEKYKKLYNDLIKKSADLREAEKDLTRRLDDIREKNSASVSALNSARLELKNLINNNEQSSDLIAQGEKLLKELKEKNKKLSKELDLIEQRHIKLDDKTKTVQEELSEVEKLIDEGELKKLKEKTEGVEEEIKTLEKSIMTVENDIEKLNNLIKFSQNQITVKNNDIKKLEEDNEKLKAEKEQFAHEIKAIEEELAVLEKEIEELGKNFAQLQAKRDEIFEELSKAKESKSKTTYEIERLAEQDESAKARRRELEPMLEAILKDFENAGINPKELEQVEISLDEINAKIAKLQKKMDDLGDVNMRALTEFDEVMERQNQYKEKVNTLEKEKNEIKSRMTGYEGLRKETFLEAYNAINTNFKEVFAQLSEGNGTLVLENESDPFAGGLTFKANIRDKKNQKLAGMSGGEKSLTALAFVFAIQKYLPSPFYALDEVDMHLDGLNVEKLGDMITDQSKTAQFIVVSLRRPMLERADQMVGVTQKEGGVTLIKTATIRNKS